MEERQPIEITTRTKGIVVYAVPNKNIDESYEASWLLLISHVIYNENKELAIYRHVSVRLSHGQYTLGPSKTPILWGKAHRYDFYLAPDEAKKLIKEQLTKSGLKYVKAINKVIDR